MKKQFVRLYYTIYDQREEQNKIPNEIKKMYLLHEFYALEKIEAILSQEIEMVQKERREVQVDSKLIENIYEEKTQRGWSEEFSK